MTRRTRCAALVVDLAHTTVPTAIMGCTLIWVASYAYLCTRSPVLLAAAACGGTASAAKVVLMRCHRRRDRHGDAEVAGTRRWERAHAAATFAVAACVGAAVWTIFSGPDLPLQMLATGLVFGYGSGVVGRLGIRPRIAAPALALAAAPPIVAAALRSDVPSAVIAAVFMVFLLGGLESVRHVHRTAVHHVGMRLEMASLARHDPLTGLANRLGLRDAFAALRPGCPVAVLCLDLDGFKPVNDRHGHVAGDALLRQVGERLVALSGLGATVARMGGDEFVLMRLGLADEAEATALVRVVDAHLREPFTVLGTEVRIGASVGHAMTAERSASLEDLLALADAASYRVKAAGRSEAPKHGDAEEGLRAAA